MMNDNPKFKNKYRIDSTRLREFDYSIDGYYFVTICTENHRHYFGEIVDSEIRLSEEGKIVAEEWQNTARLRLNVEIDEWVVMPNHLHGIIILRNTNIEVYRDAFLPENGASSLSAVIRGFKGATTRSIRSAGLEDFAWQSRFYDHIVRNEGSLLRIREYIHYNPANWDKDEYNPGNL